MHNFSHSTAAPLPPHHSPMHHPLSEERAGADEQGPWHIPFPLPPDTELPRGVAGLRELARQVRGAGA